jgi:CheY-like chemotaxis protein
MNFHALLVSKDDGAISVLSPVLSGFGLEADCCGYPDALCRLTEQKLDAVIVDFDDPHSASLVLQNAAFSKSAVTVALLSDKTKVRNVFGAGANFVLYKPLTKPQAEATLRAVTALMKRERRRSFRVPVQVPVQVHVQNGPDMEGILLDLSEDGLDFLCPQALYPSALLTTKFALPDSSNQFEINSEVAWANPNGQSGVRFVDLQEKVRTSLRSWLFNHAMEHPPEDPEPVTRCKLTDLSVGACYVETESPFPEKSGIVLCLLAGDVEVQAEGLVRVMHPGFGMGIEFASRTAEQRERVSNFINSLANSPGTQPELLVSPRALSAAANYEPFADAGTDDVEDSLVELLRGHELLSQDEFLKKLREQRSPQPDRDSILSF